MPRIKSLCIVLAVTAAILYNTWPLGYILDPKALSDSYISVLEVSGKPYAWLFIIADILSGIVVITVGLLLYKLTSLSKRSVLGYLVFGLATLIDAIIPIAARCEESVSACGIAPSQVLSPHDLASIAAAAGILSCLLGVRRRQRKTQNKSGYNWLSISYYLWCITGLLLISSVVADRFTTAGQAVYLAACGIGLIVVPATLPEIKSRVKNKLTP